MGVCVAWRELTTPENLPFFSFTNRLKIRGFNDLLRSSPSWQYSRTAESLAEPHILNRTCTFAAFRFDLVARELRKHDTKLRLEEQPARLLCALVEQAGSVVSREELHKALWGDDLHVNFDHGLNNTINKLRLVLGDDPSKPRFIETLSRRGYRFVAPVEMIPSAPEPCTPPALDALAGNPPVLESSEVNSNIELPSGAQFTPEPRSLKKKLIFSVAIAASLLMATILFTDARFRGTASNGTLAPSRRLVAVRSVSIEKNGAIDPQEEGFQSASVGRFSSDVMRSLKNRGWDRRRVVSNDQGFYYRTLSEAEKDFALSKDWKLTCVCALEKGGAWAVIDFGKDREARRFDIEFLQEGNKFFVALTKQISPKFEWEKKIEFPGVADVDHPHTYELRYDHLARTASLWIDGYLMASGYHGHNQFREDRGLLFGSGTYASSVVGIGVFRSVRFEAY
jgi:DNA-binding winged helix-turn-helix (wHTH) protein